MYNTSNKTTKICIAALLLALEIILTRFCSVSTPILRLSFGFLPIAILGILYGPIWSAAAYAIGDFIGAILFQIGDYFPGFTLTAGLSGLVFGLVLYKRPVTLRTAFIASLIVVLFMDLILNTYWLTLLYGDSYLALLPVRLLKVLLAIPIETLLIPLVWNKVITGTAHVLLRG